MINQVYQLIAPRQIGIKFDEVSFKTEKVIVRPTYLSICAADQRYYTGKRDPEALRKKLPMALIHEATGVVVRDAAGEFRPGEKVLLIPNTPTVQDAYISENYLTTSRFRASGLDGFMQEYVFMDRDRLVRCERIQPEAAAVCELVSVAMHSVRTFIAGSHGRREVIGVWGDGNLGYVTSLMLTKLLPQAKIVVFGIDPYKLDFFSFAHSAVHIDEIPEGMRIDHAFECVGGQASESAIGQIIDHINPEGTVMLMGVSESSIPIKTRMMLEKGLRFIGRSRSGRQDFIETAKYLEQYPDLQARVKKIIREVIPVSNIAEISAAFEADLRQAFKTVMKWNV
jgi:ribitol-5-phosphate 2-dehydrogenase